MTSVRALGFRYDSSRMDFPAARHVKHLDMTSYRELRPGIYRKGEFYEFSLSCQRLLGQNYPISGRRLCAPGQLELRLAASAQLSVRK